MKCQDETLRCFPTPSAHRWHSLTPLTHILFLYRWHGNSFNKWNNLQSHSISGALTKQKTSFTFIRRRDIFFFKFLPQSQIPSTLVSTFIEVSRGIHTRLNREYELIFGLSDDGSSLSLDDLLYKAKLKPIWT